MTDNVKILALGLLDKFEEHISAQLILLPYQQPIWGSFEPNFDSQKGPIGFTGLHGTALLGIVEILAAVLEMLMRGIMRRVHLSYGQQQGVMKRL